MQQFQAGYFLEAFNQEKYKPLLDILIPFDVSLFPEMGKIEDYDPYCSVLNNILCRGLPTRPSIFIEETFANTFNLTEPHKNDLGAITFPLKITEIDFKDRLYKALHFVEPRLTDFENSEKLGSDEEAKFIQGMLTNWLGGFWWQILERQRKITSVDTDAADFKYQTSDFSLELPNLNGSLQGIVIEIDGRQHTQGIQKSLDEQRDTYFGSKKWITYRLPTDKFKTYKEYLKSLVDLQNNNEYLQIIKENYENKIFDEARLTDLQLALSPLAIARIQKVLLEFFLKTPQKCYDTEGVLRLAILERDVPCAALAVDDLKQQFKNLFNLEGKGKKLTPIVLDIFTTTEFAKAQLHQFHKPKNIKNIDPSVSYDLVIDIAMLQRSGFTDLTEKISAACKINIRSAHHKNSKRTFYTSSHIEYADLAIPKDDGTFNDIEEAKPFLTYFLQNIFRKTSFRTGQLPILHRALKGQSVIGLLPTGGGKSLTYQIAALLQPGITLIIDPIKSLMKDQYDNLLKNKIDGCTYINSSLSSTEKRDNVA